MKVASLLLSPFLAPLVLASPTYTHHTEVACPGSDGARVNTRNGTFLVECGIDRSDDDYGVAAASSFGACVDYCAADPKCVQVSFKPESGSCYLKSGHGYPDFDSSIWGARLDDGLSSKISACPESDGAKYRAKGKIFQVSCGVDRRGGDIGPQIYTNLVGCIEICATTPECVDITQSGAACYLKNNLTTPVFDATFQGAQLIGTYGDHATKVSTTFVAPLPTASGTRCPAQNGTIVDRSCGAQYQVECGIDRNGYNMPSNPTYVYSLDACINECDKTFGCKDISWVPGNPGPCYLKSSVGTPTLMDDSDSIWGARQVSGCQSTMVVRAIEARATPTAHLN